MFTLQVFSGVYVPGFILLTLFAGAFLTGGFGNVLVLLVLVSLRLGAAGCRAKDHEAENQNHRHTTAKRAGRGLCGSQAADPSWGVNIRAGHANRRLTGDNAWKKSIPKKPFPGTTTFSGVGPAGLVPVVLPPGREAVGQKKMRCSNAFEQPCICWREAKQDYFSAAKDYDL